MRRGPDRVSARSPITMRNRRPLWHAAGLSSSSVSACAWKGWSCSTMPARYPEACQALTGWIGSGEMRYREHIVDGLAAMPGIVLCAVARGNLWPRLGAGGQLEFLRSFPRRREPLKKMAEQRRRCVARLDPRVRGAEAGMSGLGVRRAVMNGSEAITALRALHDGYAARAEEIEQTRHLPDGHCGKPDRDGRLQALTIPESDRRRRGHRARADDRNRGDGCRPMARPDGA